MKADDYRKALDSANAEIQEVLRQKAVLDARLSQLAKTVDALKTLLESLDEKWLLNIGNVLDEAILSEMGITDAIRQIFEEAKNPLRPPEIRDILASRKVDLSQYANSLAVIHNTLVRLEKQGEISRMEFPSGTAYVNRQKWVGPGSAERSGMLGSELIEDSLQGASSSTFPADHPIGGVQRADQEKRMREKAARIDRIKKMRD